MGGAVCRCRRAHSARLLSGVLSWQPPCPRYARAWSNFTQLFDLQIKGTHYGPAKKPSKKQGAVGTVVFVGKVQGGKPTDLFIIVYTPVTKYTTTPSLGKPFLFYIATRQELQAIKNPGKQQPKFTTDWVSY